MGPPLFSRECLYAKKEIFCKSNVLLSNATPEVYLLLVCASPAYAVEDMWTVGREIITDVYSQIAGISTVLAGLMSAVAVLGCKFSGGRQQRVDQSWDWLKRIWIAWAVINGIGAFIAYVAPLFSGLATLEPGA